MVKINNIVYKLNEFRILKQFCYSIKENQCSSLEYVTKVKHFKANGVLNAVI